MAPAKAGGDGAAPSPRPPEPTPADTTPDALTDREPPPRGEIVVIVAAQDFRLPDVLRHVEAGRTVLVIPAPPRSA